MEHAGMMVLKLVVAAVLGGVVGYERELQEHPAGLRTHILVSIGAALMTLVSLSFARGGQDPSRIAAQIVSGIGFLGAGSIIRQGNYVRGLTTAASLWAVAGVGMAVAIGGEYMFLATAATLIIFATLSLLRGLEPHHRGERVRTVDLVMPGYATDAIGELVRRLGEIGITINRVSRVESNDEGRRSYRLTLLIPDNSKSDEALKILNELVGPDNYEWV